MQVKKKAFFGCCFWAYGGSKEAKNDASREEGLTTTALASKRDEETAANLTLSRAEDNNNILSLPEKVFRFHQGFDL